MPGYYDRLGDLLSEVLESGIIPEKKADEVSAAKIPAEPLPAFPFVNAPSKVRAALKTLSIPEDADFTTARSLYRQKLMRFHPDRQNDNALLQKVARTKTAQFIEAWAVIEEYCEKINRLHC